MLPVTRSLARQARRSSDLLRVGLPLQLTFGVLTVLTVPLLFPF
jgi:di/tricarboxylate transporter